jgi:hypothetical protein
MLPETKFGTFFNIRTFVRVFHHVCCEIVIFNLIFGSSGKPTSHTCTAIRKKNLIQNKRGVFSKRKKETPD